MRCDVGGWMLLRAGADVVLEGCLLNNELLQLPDGRV